MNIFFIIISAVVSYTILYFIIKAAVRNGIIEARHIKGTPPGAGVDEEKSISQKACPSCGGAHDIDYPKCPYCKHQY